MSESQLKAQLNDLCEQLTKAREEVCQEYCKYTNGKEYRGISQEELEEICNKDCPLGKI